MALERNEENSMPTTESNPATETRLATRDFRDRIWVTRPRPGIDRMSTAWLVRRFIDPAATFRFTDPERRSELGPTAVPFDMYGVELGHQRGGCTFETVVRRFAIDDAAVARLARIVHQLDLKTEEQPAPEAAVIGNMVEGLRRMYADDAELLERGIVMFESLYRSQGDQRSATAASAAKQGVARKQKAAGNGAILVAHQARTVAPEVVTGLLGDVRSSLRGLASRPAFTAGAVVALALGIGANLGLFTLGPCRGPARSPLSRRRPSALDLVDAHRPRSRLFLTARLP